MKTTTVTPTPEMLLTAKNEAVKSAFFAIVDEIKELIKLYPTEYLRTYLEVDCSKIGYSSNYCFYSPLVHLRFEAHTGECSIYFAKNFGFKQQIGNYLDTILTRCVFKHTAAANTTIDIEDALNVSMFRPDDYKEAKAMLDKGFKGCQKVTVEQIKKEA